MNSSVEASIASVTETVRDPYIIGIREKHATTIRKQIHPMLFFFFLGQQIFHAREAHFL